MRAYESCFFTPKRRSEFETKSKDVSPIKLKRFKMNETNNTKTIFLSREAEIVYTAVDTNNIASLTGAHLNQLIDIKATLSQLSTIKKLETRMD